VAFVAPGNPITAAQLTALTADLDAILTAAFGGLSWLAYDRGAVLPRSTTIYLGPTSSRFFFPGEPEYDHQTFVDWIAGSTIRDYDDERELAIIGVPALGWPLDDSVEAHTVDHVPTGATDAKKYWLAKYYDPLDSTSFRERERFRRFDTLDVVFDGGTYPGDAFTWPANWDKYHCLRFHNLRDSPLTINLPPGGQFLTLPPFGIHAVRRDYPAGAVWRASYRYLWEPVSGDQLVFETVPPQNWTPDEPRFSNLTTLSYFSHAITLLSTQPILFFDPSKRWKPASVSPYPPIADERRVIDYQVAPGTIHSVRAASAAPMIDTLTWATWPQLEAGIGDIGDGTPVLRAVPIADGWQLTGHGTDHDCMGISSELFPELRPVTLPQTVLYGFGGAYSVTGARVVMQTVEVKWRPDPNDPPFDPDSFVTVSVDAPLFADGLHTTTIGGATTFGESKTLTTAGLVSRPSVLTFAWDNWELAARGVVEFDAGPAEILDAIAPPISRIYVPRDFWEGGVADQFGLTFKLPLEIDALPVSQETDIAPVRIPRRIQLGRGFEDSFGVWHHTGHPDLEGDEGLAGGIEWNFERLPFEDSKIARRGITAGGISTRSLPVRPLADSADRILGLSPSAYRAQRTAILAGELTDAELGRIVRIPVTAEQYNIIAGLLASVVFVAPQTIALSSWWDLGFGGSPVDGAYVPEDLGSFADPAGRATLLGLTVRSASIGGFDVTYVTHADLAAAAAAKGWPYQAATLEVPAELDESGDWIRGTGAWCVQLLLGALVLKWTKETEVQGFPPQPPIIYGSHDAYAAVPGYPQQDTGFPSPVVRIVDSFWSPAAPPGWQIKRDTRLVTRPVECIIYDHADPIPATIALDTVPRIVQPAETEESRAWLVSYLTTALGGANITPIQLAGLYAGDWDPRSATLLTLIPRSGFVRTTS